MTEFADLNRRFVRASDKEKPEESALQSYLIADFRGDDGSLGWPEVLQSPVTVILGEPGSGKSTELRQQTDKLSSQSENAFFVRLDRLVEEPLISVLGERERKKFGNWKKSRHEAYFFFDSVDESKLRRPDDFLTALERIGDTISIQDLRRTHLIFSSRISEWRPVTDMQALRRLFPATKQSDNAGREDQGQGGRSFPEQNDIGYEVEQQRTAETNEIAPLVVQILPLDADRVRIYAQWRGLTDIDEFIRALDTRHAWEFARRPLDVHWLIDFWQQHGRLGSLTELIEHNLSISLRESEGRETLDPLTATTARQGAEALAAAALLCRNLNFKVPDDAYVSVDTAAIDSTSCLSPTWHPRERRALLTRPLFDGATYGCIRFHHRRTMEYLASSWLNERMRDGCPQDHLDDLIFALHHGELILRPTLAPVVAWLANGDEPHNIHVRERILQADPGIHLKYGDPEQLPIEYKRKVLNALVTRYADRERNWLDTDSETLARLADPRLAPDVSAIIRNRQLADSLRADMLLLVRHGCLTDCLETALEIFADSTEDEDIKYYAVAAIRDCGNTEFHERLSTAAGTQSSMPSSLSGLLCETLYSEVIDANGVADLLQKTEPSSERSFDLPWTLKHHLREKLTPNAAGSLLNVFMGLLRTAPCLEDGREEQISLRFHWLYEVLPAVLVKLFEKNNLSSEDARLSAGSIRIIEEDWTYGSHIDAKEVEHLSASINRHSILKKEFFWQGVERYRVANQREPDWFPQVIGFRDNIVKIDASDIVWLIEAVSTRQSAADRLLALYFAFELWQPYSIKWMPWFNLLGVTIKQPELRRLFWKYSWKRLSFPVRALWYRNIKKFLDKHWWTHKGYKLRHTLNQIRDICLLHRHLNRLYSGSAAHWLASLSYEANRDHKSSRWAADDWSSLRKKRGPLVAWATRHGCEITWVRHSPLLPHEKPNPNQTSSLTVAGLCGLQSLWHRGKLDFKDFKESDAIRAARYAMNELNGFSDWLPELAIAKPEAVRVVLTECIEAEWRIPPEREYPGEILHKLVWQGERYWPLIADDLLSHLQLQDPQHSKILSSVLTIFLRSPNGPYSQLIALASRRVADYQPATGFFIAWLALWLQIEARGAINYLMSRMSGLSASEADNLILRLCNSLGGDRINSAPHIASPDYLHPQVMRIFVPLIYRHIRPSEDIVHRSGEAHSVTDRDHAQEFRNGLLQRLSQLEHPEVLATLNALRDAPELIKHRDWIARLIDQHILHKVDLDPWQPEDIRTFTSDYEADPRNDTDLFRIACWRLQDIKHEVERAENSLRGEVQRDWDEAKLRQWFQRRLSEHSRQRYTIPQEAVIDQEQRPDLRFENPAIRSAIPVELKWSDNWTAPELLERLENQLVGQYLRAHNVRYGIYLLGYIGRKQHWDHPTDQRRINFGELVNIIEHRAQELEQTRTDVAGIRVIAINFTVFS